MSEVTSTRNAFVRKIILRLCFLLQLFTGKAVSKKDLFVSRIGVATRAIKDYARVDAVDAS